MTSFKLVFFSEFIDHFVYLLNRCVACVYARHIQNVRYGFEKYPFFSGFYD
jgi:hypothetical protein